MAGILTMTLPEYQKLADREPGRRIQAASLAMVSEAEATPGVKQAYDTLAR
jgi:hypothetical protein